MLTFLPVDGSVFTVPEHMAECVGISLEVYEDIHEVYREPGSNTSNTNAAYAAMR